MTQVQGQIPDSMPRRDGHNEAVVFAAIRSSGGWRQPYSPFDAAMGRPNLRRVLVAEIDFHLGQLGARHHKNLEVKIVTYRKRRCTRLKWDLLEREMKR